MVVSQQDDLEAIQALSERIQGGADQTPDVGPTVERISERIQRRITPIGFKEAALTTATGAPKEAWDFVPYLATGREGYAWVQMYAAADAFNEGRQTKEQRRALEDLLDWSQRNKTFWGGVGGLAGDIPVYALEFAGGMKIAGLLGREIMKTVAGKGLAKALERLARSKVLGVLEKNAATKALGKMAGGIASGAAKGIAIGAVNEIATLPTEWSRIQANARRLLFQQRFDIGENEAGVLMVEIADPEVTLWDVMPEAAFRYVVEYGSEMTGGALPIVGRLQAFQDGILARFFTKVGFERGRKILKAQGYDGVWREIGEEFAGAAALELGGEKYRGSLKETWDQTLQMYVAFSLHGGSMRGLGVAGEAFLKRDLDKRTREDIERDIRQQYEDADLPVDEAVLERRVEEELKVAQEARVIGKDEEEPTVSDEEVEALERMTVEDVEAIAPPEEGDIGRHREIAAEEAPAAEVSPEEAEAEAVPAEEVAEAPTLPAEAEAESGEEVAEKVEPEPEEAAVEEVAAYPAVGEAVDGRTIGEGVPNTDSISASLGEDWEELPGIREVPLSDFPGLTGRSYSTSENERIRALADEIDESGRVDPLIVVVGEAEGPYILEGGHRADALKLLGAESFPALVVRDTSEQGPQPALSREGPTISPQSEGRRAEAGASLPGEETQEISERPEPEEPTIQVAAPPAATSKAKSKVAEGAAPPSRPPSVPASGARGGKKPGAAGKRMLAPEIPETRWTKFIEEWVDKALPAKQAEDIIEDMGGFKNLTPEERDAQAPYMAAMLSRGKQRDVVRRLRMEFFNPITRKLKRAKLAIGDIHLYLIGRHARERTQWFIDRAEVGEDLGRPFDHGENNGSGMLSDEADALVAEYEAANSAYAEVGELFDKMNRFMLDMRLKWGLISEDTHAELVSRWEHYAPLENAESLTHTPSKPHGYSVRGPEWKKAKGRISLSDNPLVLARGNALAAVERSINNDVTERMTRLLRENQGVIGTTIREVPEDELDLLRRTGRRTEVPDNVYSYKDKGKQVEVMVKSIPLARAMKGLDAPQLFPWLLRIGRLTRLLASLYTSKSPEFFLFSNPSRDTLVTIFTSAGLAKPEWKWVAAKIIKGAPSAAGEMWRGLSGKEESEAFAEASKLGAFSAGAMVQRNYEQSYKQIEKELKRGSVASALVLAWERFDLFSDTTENALRLSAYKVFLGLGMTKEQAALAAKEITLNFDRVGSKIHYLSWYKAFIGAGMAGARQAVMMSKNPRVQKIIAMYMAYHFMIAVYNRIMMGDDDDGVPKWDRVPLHVKERNSIIATPEGIPNIIIPQPWGFGAFAAIATASADMIFGDEMSVGDAAMMSGSALMSGLSPINPGPLPQMLTPTVLAPMTQIYTNQSHYGAPLMPPEYQYGREIPDSERYWGTSPSWFRAASNWMNDLTGGDEYDEGWSSFSPESLEAWYDAYLGGPGRILKDAIRLGATPFEEWKPSRIPFIRKFAREADEWSMRADYYEAMEHLRQIKDRRGGIDGRNPVRPQDERYLPLLREFRAHWGQFSKVQAAMKASKAAEGDEKRRLEEEGRKAMLKLLKKYREATDHD